MLNISQNFYTTKTTDLEITHDIDPDHPHIDIREITIHINRTAGGLGRARVPNLVQQVHQDQGGEAAPRVLIKVDGHNAIHYI